MTDLSGERIATRPLVLSYTAPNPGPKTLTGTRTYVVGHNPAYVIDPGPALPDYISTLAAAVRNLGVAGILLTHAHPDHAPGALLLKEQLGSPIWASGAMAPDVRACLGVDCTYGQSQTFPADGDVLQVVPSPGHTPDHVAFWLPGARVLFAGDTILGQGTTLIAPPEGNMREYMQTLDRLWALDPRIIAPGHGPTVRAPRDTIDEYIRHRRERERAVVAALRRGPATIEDLVAEIYRDVDPSLHGLAAGSLLAQLEKLQEERRVSRQGDRYALREGADDGR